MGRKISFRIHTQRRSYLAALLTLTLLVALFLGNLAWGQRVVAASYRSQAPQAPAAVSSDLRGYYLTQARYDGASALTACANGYHMASMWEIIDPSNLKYNTALGYTRDDSGQGPPTQASIAWVHTGYGSSAGFGDPPGTANCNAWSSGSESDLGTYVRMNSTWKTAETISVWNATTNYCSNSFHVWCVADSIGFTVHMPLVVYDN